MVYCFKCGSKNDDLKEKCDKCGEILVKNDFTASKSFEKFEDVFTDENKRALNSLTVDAYNTIITNITEMGRYHLEKYYESHDRDSLNVMDRVKAIVLAYSEINYKSTGAELGSYSFNSIRVDDRLDTSHQIATLLHELSHHLFSEIFEQTLMYIWGCDKSDAVEALAWFILIGSPLTQLSNEYCAHTCEGRFVLHGYQNYGSFNKILNDNFNATSDKEAITTGLIFGNTIAKDILVILEEFIDYDLREEIKEQFKKDFTYAPKYDQILLETSETLPDVLKIETMKAIMRAGYSAAEDKSMAEVLETFKENFSEINN